MKRFFCLVTLAALAVLANTGLAQSKMSASMVGVGPNGYDWLIGTWTCTTNMPSAMGGPSVTTLTASRSAGGAIFLRSIGKGFDESGYLAYAPKTKTWWNPDAFADGSFESESTTQTGKKTVWTGSFFDASSGKLTHTRDTYVVVRMKTFTDLGEHRSAGGWTATYNITCKK
jgi:hypothetical protein